VLQESAIHSEYPELNEKFARAEKSMDLVEISKLLSEIYRYAYDQYLEIPIAKCRIRSLPQKGYPNGTRASAAWIGTTTTSSGSDRRGCGGTSSGVVFQL